MVETREIFWNIPRDLQLVFYAVSTLVLAVFFLGVLHRMSLWLKGKDDPESVLHGLGLMGLVKLSLYTLFSTGCIFTLRIVRRATRGVRYGFLIGRVSLRTRFFKEGFTGVMHPFFAWGFFLLFLGTMITQLNYDFHLNFLKGDFYLSYSLLLDVAGLLLVIGAMVRIHERYVARPDPMVSSREDGLVLLAVLFIPLLGFTTEGLRLAVLQPSGLDWSPVGAVFAQVFLKAGLSEAVLRWLHLSVWIGHISIALLLIAYIPFSKLFHMVAAQITTHALTKKGGECIETLKT